MVEGATFCKDCGAPLEATGPIARDLGMRPVIAFVLSVVPGLGHVYQRHPWRGIGWFFGVMIAYGASPPLGFLLHLICAANAAVYATMHKGGTMPGGRGVRGANPAAPVNFRI